MCICMYVYIYIHIPTYYIYGAVSESCVAILVPTITLKHIIIVIAIHYTLAIIIYI